MSNELIVAGALGVLFGAALVGIAHIAKRRTGSYIGMKQCPNCGYGFNSVFLRHCTICKHPLKISPENPSFQERVSLAFGKTIIVGLTYQDASGTVLEHKQLHGKIIRIDPVKGIEILLHQSDSSYFLPPRLSLLKLALPGEYRLRSTGEIVINPDFITDWIVNRAQ